MVAVKLGMAMEGSRPPPVTRLRRASMTMKSKDMFCRRTVTEGTGPHGRPTKPRPMK